MAPSPQKPRIILADDHRLLLDGLSALLSPKFDLLPPATDGWAAVNAFERLRPDVLVLDIGLPLLNGIEVTRRVMQISPEAKVLIVSVQVARPYVIEAFQSGASGYLSKHGMSAELITAINALLSGKKYISPLITEKIGNIPLMPTDKSPNLAPPLTARQREVLQLIAEGRSMKEMAHILGISVRTVEFHKNSLVQTLGIRSTAELTRCALDLGIVSNKLM